MFYLKHPQHGNRHVASRDEANQLQREGWTLWPRSNAEKAGTAIAVPTAAVAVTSEPVRASVDVGKAVRNTLKLGRK